MNKLTPQKFEEIAGGVQRLRELSETKILSPSQDAEKSGLERFLSSAFLEYAAEFLGAQSVIFNEYVPLVQAVGALMHRANNAGGIYASIGRNCHEACGAAIQAKQSGCCKTDSSTGSECCASPRAS